MSAPLADSASTPVTVSPFKRPSSQKKHDGAPSLPRQHPTKSQEGCDPDAAGDDERSTVGRRRSKGGPERSEAIDARSDREPSESSRSLPDFLDEKTERRMLGANITKRIGPSKQETTRLGKPHHRELTGKEASEQALGVKMKQAGVGRKGFALEEHGALVPLHPDGSIAQAE